MMNVIMINGTLAYTFDKSATIILHCFHLATP